MGVIHSIKIIDDIFYSVLKTVRKEASLENSKDGVTKGAKEGGRFFFMPFD